MTPYLPTMDELRTTGTPRVHPNGFIQLDLDWHSRLHVWHPNLPYRQKTYHPVHDHVFDFNSYMFSGRLVHVPYVLLSTMHGTHCVWEATCTRDNESILEPIAQATPVRLVPYGAETLQPGEGYTFKAFRFHETLANEPTLTIIRKHDATIHQGNTDRPRIAVPVDVTPDNDFQRDAVDKEILWQLIEEAHP